jgi:16S rRNA (uracil1498-N3)-methyltransferase
MDAAYREMLLNLMIPCAKWTLAHDKNMAIPRFYCPIDITPSSQQRLPESAAHHALKVLRLKRGDQITMFNGGGGEFEASIHLASREAVIVDIGKHIDVERESTLATTLVQSLSSAERMDLTLQKSVELGVSEIQPIVTDRSIVRLEGERAERRARHWQNVVIAACEQCGRNRVPQVLPMLSFDDWLAAPRERETQILLSPQGGSYLDQLRHPSTKVHLLAGPEGGLTDFERQRAVKAGFNAVVLGPRILRTETAALAALSAMQMLWGDFARP